MKSSCDNLVVSSDIKCYNIQNPLSKISFNFDTKKVYDDNYNFLGYGELKGAILIISKNKNK